MLRFLRLLRRAVWRAFEHDAFGLAKGAAYSSILTLFPALMLVASVLATRHRTDLLSEISYAISWILPPGASRPALAYFENTPYRPLSVLIPTSLLTLWAASGVMISWMEAFRNAYQLPKTWGLVKERLIAFLLVILAGIPLAFATFLVAFGNQIERWMMMNTTHVLGPYILLTWMVLRWTIGILSSMALTALVYHHAVPRTQPWHSVLPGAALTTAVWFPATMLFGWYVSHYAAYSLMYGSLATAIALLVWLYILSIIVMVGAELNALLFPRVVLDHLVEAKRPSTKVAS
jgi:membrane protein